MFQGPFNHSIIKRSINKKIATINFINLRNFGIGPHKLVDDTPYGGGAGMILRADVLYKAIEKTKTKSKKEKTILLSAIGEKFTQKKAEKYSNLSHLIIVCGHYEGIDERIKDFVDEEISIGDFILTGGEIPAMLIVDSVIRIIPGSIREGASATESFSGKERLLEYPHYTKPQSFKGKLVPDVLLSGNHAEIDKWRLEKSNEITKKKRPDLIKPRE